jgi:small-conductance mechanosensitive channel
MQVEMNAAHAIRRLEEAGFTHQQATGVVEVVQGEVLDTVATRDYVGEQIALVRKDLAEQIGAVRHEIGTVRHELVEQIGAVREELAEQIGAVREELAEQIGAVREELAAQIGAVRHELAVEVGRLRTEMADTRTELMRAINRQTFWMNGFLAALLVAVLGLGGVVIGKL